MLTYLRTGTPAYQEIFGRPFWEDLDAHPEIAESFDNGTFWRTDAWGVLDAHPEIAESFDRLMGPEGHGVPDPEIPLTGGWEALRSVVDVGGGTGAMLAEILRARPWIHGTLIDLPRTVASATELFRSAGLTGRVTVIGQSFFDRLPAGADLYMLRGVLNDWPDRDAAAILRRCAAAARPGGRVMVLKSVGPEAPAPGLPIEMLLLGGRHRTIAEFRVLANQSGLEVVAAGRGETGQFAVECRPV
ncbi:MAG: methyltransferase [Bryobacteraceae bacterium]